LIAEIELFNIEKASDCSGWALAYGGSAALK